MRGLRRARASRWTDSLLDLWFSFGFVLVRFRSRSRSRSRSPSFGSVRVFQFGFGWQDLRLGSIFVIHSKLPAPTNGAVGRKNGAPVGGAAFDAGTFERYSAASAPAAPNGEIPIAAPPTGSPPSSSVTPGRSAAFAAFASARAFAFASRAFAFASRSRFASAFDFGASAAETRPFRRPIPTYSPSAFAVPAAFAGAF